MKTLEPVYREAIKVSCTIYILGLIEFILFTVFMSFRTDILLGVLYGCAFSSASFFYLARCVKKCAERDEKAAKAYMSATYSIRMLFTAAMIIVAAKVKYIYLWSAIVPLIFTRIAIYIVSFLDSHSKKGSEKI